MTGAEMIVAERKRQIEAEGWDAEHDDEYLEGQLVDAAICYATNTDAHDGEVRTQIGAHYPYWPWSDAWDKRNKHGQLRSLAIAGALIAAEIDRLQRKGGA